MVRTVRRRGGICCCKGTALNISVQLFKQIFFRKIDITDKVPYIMDYLHGIKPAGY